MTPSLPGCEELCIMRKYLLRYCLISITTESLTCQRDLKCPVHTLPLIAQLSCVFCLLLEKSALALSGIHSQRWAFSEGTQSKGLWSLTESQLSIGLAITICQRDSSRSSCLKSVLVWLVWRHGAKTLSKMAKADLHRRILEPSFSGPWPT